MTDAAFFGVPPQSLPIDDVDWQHRGDYLWTRSSRKPGDFDVEPEWATQAVFDENRKIAAPDPASKTGETIRVLGYSQSVNRVLAVVLRPKKSARDRRVVVGSERMGGELDGHPPLSGVRTNQNEEVCTDAC